ncbi:MAG: hypothetical protein WC054_01585 [Candidatus Nanopelagicales bacterium]
MSDPLNRFTPEQEDEATKEVTRRRFLTWVGAGTGAAVAGGIALSRLFESDDSLLNRAAGGEENGFETRMLNFAMPTVGLLKPKQLSIWVAGKEFPIMPHTANTWAQFTDQNPVGHRFDREFMSHYVAGTDGSSVEKLQLSKSRVAMAIVYATLPTGQEVPVSTVFLVPQGAQRRVTLAATENKRSLEQLFGQSEVLKRLKLRGSNGLPTNVDESVALGDTIDVNSATSAGLVYCAPWIRTVDPAAAAITMNLIASTGSLSGLIKAIETLAKKTRAPYGILEDMVKGVKSGKIVPQTLDPRLGTSYEKPPGEPTISVDPEIGELPAKTLIPFVQMGMKWQGKEIPRDLIFNYKAALQAALAEGNEVVQAEPDLGAMINAETDLNDLGGKTWAVMPATPPSPITVSDAARSNSAGGGVLAKFRGSNDAKVNYSVLQGEKKSRNGMYVQLKETSQAQGGGTQLKLRVWNNLDRTVTFGVQYFDSRDLPISPPDDYRLSNNKLDPTWRLGARLLESIPIVMGLPVGLDSNYLDISIPMPAEAVRARVIAGSLGTGNDWRDLFKSVELDANGTEVLGPDGKPKLLPAYVDTADNHYVRPDWYQDAVFTTAVVDIGIPGLMFLSQAIAANRFRNMCSQTTSDYKTIKHDDGEIEITYLTAEDIAKRRKSGFGAIYWIETVFGLIEGLMKGRLASTSNQISAGIIAISKMILDFLTYRFIYKAMGLYLETLTESTIQKAIPIYGQIYIVTALAGAASQVGQATGAVCQNDTNYWDLSATYDAVLTAKPQFDSGFSKSAACWKVTVLLENQTEGKEYLPAGFKETIEVIDGDKYSTYAVIPAFENPRTEPLEIPLPQVPFGGRIQYIITILSQDGWTVGSAATDWLDNSNLKEVKDSIEVTVLEDAVELGSKSRLERRWTTDVAGGRYVMAQGAEVPGTIHDADFTLGSVMYGHGTGLMGYVYKSAGKWFVRQLNSSEDPGASAAELSTTYTGNPPIVLTDPLQNRTNGVAEAWLLEPVAATADEQDGYHIRKLALGNNSIVFDPKKVYGHIPTRVHAASLAPGGLITGINTDSAQLSILRPALKSHAVDEGTAPVASVFGGPGNKDGARPGLFDKPVGLAVSSNGVLVILEQGAKRLSAFNLLGVPVKAFASENSNSEEEQFYAPTDPGVTLLDVGNDGDGYVYVLGYRNAGTTINDYVLDVYAPKSETRLFRVEKVNSGRMAVDWFRDVYSLNYQSIKALSGQSTRQPSVSIWVPRTPRRA